MAGSLEICQVCLKHMDDPRILPCHHSFCLKCLESSATSTKSCPTCKMEFEILEGGLKNLKKNDFIEKLNILKQNNINCDSCNANEAVKFCVECSFNYCSTCLGPHGRIPTTINHQLETARTSKHGNKVNKYSTCEEHSDVMNLFCEDCSVISCCFCFSLMHNTHKMKHLSHHVDSVKQRIKENLILKEEMLESVTSNQKIFKNVTCNNETRASNLKEEMKQRGEDLKKVVDSIVLDLIENVDEELKQKQKETEDVMKELKNIEMDLNGQIETLKQHLNSLNYENVHEISSQNDKNIDCQNEDIPKYSRIFNISLFYEINEQRTQLEKIFGTLRRGLKFELNKEIMLDGLCQSFATIRDHLFFCIDGSVINVFSNDGLTLRSTYEFENEISKVFDILSVNEMLYVSCLDGCNTITIMKMKASFKDPPVVISKFEHKSNICNLAKSFCGNILLILQDELKILSEKGTSLKLVNLAIDVCDALPLDSQHYVVCSTNKELCVVDGGTVIHKYLSLNVDCDINSPFCLAKDSLGNVYVGDIYGNVFVLDCDLKFLKSHVVKFNRNVRKMCYDEIQGALFILVGNFDNSSLLNFV